ncbi:aldehyde oxidase 4-like isoform X1 [Lycium barbarum]|uniref:aldehyde oxidase 4-like isoform X1 n=1 Tax=Lycium barbarum TaxID=112863 RepID=UPI00293E32A6|nr:aldehyde oxidase 4-like isoform X1 [Lycium barbarum]
MEGSQRNGNLVFAVNGERFELACVDPSTTLLQFLRYHASFKSPKLGCGEGGCGACVVLVSKYDPKLNKVEDFSVSSCLTLLCSLNGCAITTSDGLGNTRDGYHPIHQRFAGFHASQCGFCTPGMCMSFFSALVNADKGNPQVSPPQGFSSLTSFEAEKSISGNLCRCTGYRPIADACRSFASDVDIEDLGLNIFWKNGDSTETKAGKLPPYDPSKDLVTYPEFLKSESITRLDSTRYSWFSPVSIEELQTLLNSSVAENVGSVKIVVGNTGTGYYKETQCYDQYIDLRRIPELSILNRDRKGIEIGATATISRVISFLNEGTDVNLGLYGKMVSQKLAQHMEKIANPFVRNTASVGGNLAMAQKFGFPSDMSTLFLGVDATVSILTVRGREKLKWEELLARPALDSRSVLLSVRIPFKKDGNVLQNFSKFLFETYRPAPRPLGSALAYVNAAFLADVSPRRNGVVIHSIRLAFGAFGTNHAIRAKTVEKHLTGKILNVKILYEAVKFVKLDIVPEPGTSYPEYRSSLAVSFLFKFLYPLTNVDSAVSSGLFDGVGETSVEDGDTSEGNTKTILSPAEQVVESSTEYYPVGEPMKKYGVSMQASGEAVYVDDIPSPPNCLHGAIIYSTKPLARVKSVHLQHQPNSIAEEIIGIITFKDIPRGGENVGALSQFGTEPLFAEDHCEYAGDRIVVVVAKSQRSADVAARTTVVEYDTENIDSPILTVEEAVDRSSFLQGPVFLDTEPVGDFSKGMAEADHKILSAELRLPSEYYFYMEPQTTLAVPDEDNTMVVYASTQFPEYTHSVIARCLGVPEHNIRVKTRRAGGGFGGKAIRNMPVSTACALAAYKLRHPVRVYVNRNTDMVITGGRHPLKVTYSVGFKSNGKVTALHADILINGGISDDITPVIASHVIAALKKYNWGAFSFDLKNCKTNLTSKSSMRALGDVQGSYIADVIIENVASVLEMEVDSVISQNVHTYESLKLFYEHSAGESGEYTLPSIMDQLATSSRFVDRRNMIDEFNEKNTWKKRGISRLPIVHEVMQHATPAKVSVLQDGSIVCEVGGVEIGQGLWTKVKQVIAYALSLIERSWSEELVEKVRIIQIDTLSLVQTGFTAESTKSESSCEAARRCCNILVERLTPLKEKLQEQNGSVDWTTLIREAEAQPIDLQAHAYFVPDSSSGQYLNYGAAVSEVEIDILTGQPRIMQSDIIYDCGQSLNPAVDLGQIEGAFVQGIGYFMLEEYLTNEDGLMVTNSTWTYHIPTIDTITKRLNVRVLNSGHHKKRILSSKASGEPPLLLAATVHSATRAAIREARKQLKHWGKLDKYDSEFYLDVPAIMPVVKTTCGLDYVEKYLETLISKPST